MTSKLKKVLIITYYWPPTGGSGVQRWLKMSKYFKKNGWEPVVYTPANPEGGALDMSLMKDVPQDLKVIKRKILEPFELYKKLTGRKKGEMIGTGFLSEKETPSFAEKLSVWVRGNFFIPDARMLWVKPSYRFLKRYLKSNPVDLVVSTGPPHSMHLIALKLKEKLNIPWVADFRDPWTGIDFYDQLMLTHWADKRHHRLEQRVLKTADRVVTVNWNLADDLEKIGNRKADVVTNGYDEDDYRFIDKTTLDGNFSICHLGSMNKDRNHEIFWKTLGSLVNENEGFKRKLSVKLIGATDITARNMIKAYGLEKYVEMVKFMEHENALKTAAKAQLLYLPLNNTPNAMGITPTKLFEYLALKRPVLCIGPEQGDAAKIINETGCGVVAGFENGNKLRESLLDYFTQYESNGFITVDSGKIEQYSRRVLANKMSTIFNDLV